LETDSIKVLNGKCWNVDDMIVLFSHRLYTVYCPNITNKHAVQRRSALPHSASLLIVCEEKGENYLIHLFAVCDVARFQCDLLYFVWFLFVRLQVGLSICWVCLQCSRTKKT